MAVKRVGMAIAIWVVCAVLLVVVIVLAIYLFCCLRNRRRRTCDVDEEEEDVRVNRHETYLTRYNGDVALRVDSDGEDMRDDIYRGYRRVGTQDLLCTPTPGAYQTQALLVQLTSYTGTTASGRVDVLVNVMRQDASVPDPRYAQNAFSILGNLYDQPGFFFDDFLLYTAPFHFTVPGRYVIQAYTVNTHSKTVGAVHQFVYLLSTAEGGVGWISGAEAAHGANRRIDVRVDQQSGSLVPYGGLAGPSAGSAAHRGGAPGSDNDRYATANAVATTSPQSLVPFSVLSHGEGGEPGMPLPPRIAPSQGAVTTTTRIVISPHPHSAGGDFIRYSVDGSYPNLVYTGPFTLSLPPASVLPERQLSVRVKAISIAAAASSTAASATSRYTNAGPSSALVAQSAMASPVVEAVLTVRPAGYSYYDPALPTPSMRVRAQGAKLYFDETNNPMRTCTCYQIVYLQDARQHKVRFNRRKCEVYKGHPIPLVDTIAMVYAWTVDEAALLGDGEEDENELDERGGDTRGAANDPFTIFSPTSPGYDGRQARRGAGMDARGTSSRIRSVATIYNCSRASTEHGQVSRKRVPAGAALLPPPVLCISCDEVEVEFDEPPAHALIAYTLNNKEPALFDVTPPACAVPIPTPGSMVTSSRRPGAPRTTSSRSRHGGNADAKGEDDVVEGDAEGRGTFLYEVGKPIRVTQLESDGVCVTARIFAPVYEAAGGDVVGDAGAQGGTASAGGSHLGYRYGDAFHRGFFFHKK